MIVLYDAEVGMDLDACSDGMEGLLNWLRGGVFFRGYDAVIGDGDKLGIGHGWEWYYYDSILEDWTGSFYFVVVMVDIDLSWLSLLLVKLMAVDAPILYEAMSDVIDRSSEDSVCYMRQGAISDDTFPL